MPAHKTHAFLLRLLPYQESSAILHLYSEALGMVHGVARGCRRPSKGSQPVERGNLVECLVYTKPNRTLHTIGSLHVQEFYPTIRSDLHRTAMRDAAFEMVLRTVHPEEPHPPLYDRLSLLLDELEAAPGMAGFPFPLWRFLVDYASLMGFGVDLDTCSHCRRRLTPDDTVHLLVERGTVICRSCAGVALNRGTLPAPVRSWLATPAHNSAPPTDVTPDDQKRITRMLANFCRHHFDIRAEMNAVEFVCGLVGNE